MYRNPRIKKNKDCQGLISQTDKLHSGSSGDLAHATVSSYAVNKPEWFDLCFRALW